MRFKPSIDRKEGRYYGRLDIIGFGTSAVDRVDKDFDTAEAALAEIIRRLRYIARPGDKIEVEGRSYESLMAVEAVLRANLLAEKAS